MKKYLELILFFLTLLNLVFPFIPQPVLLVVIMSGMLYRLPKCVIIFFCLTFFKDIIHAFSFLNFHISGTAFIVFAIGLFYTKDFLLQNRQKLLNVSRPLVLIVLYLLLSCLLAGNIDVPNDKATDLLINSVTFFVSYSYILTYKDRINFFNVALYTSIWALFLLQLNVIKNGYPLPGSLFDFGFYRSAVGEDMYVDLASYGISYATHYQFFGFVSAIGLALAFTFEKLNVRQILTLLAFNVIVVGYSGARQFLLLTFLMIGIYIFFSKIKFVYKAVFFAVIGSVFSYIIFNSILSEYILKVTENGILEGSGRVLLFEVAVNLFQENPLWGVGFCGYNFYGNYNAFPHNMIVEMLAELGILGFIIVCGIFLYKNQPIKRLFSFSSQFCPFFLFILFLGRAMISGSLADNIAFFSVMVSMSFILKYGKLFNNNSASQSPQTTL